MVLLLALPLSLLGAMKLGLVGAAAGSVAALYAERYLSLKRIAELTSTPIARLQDWGTLARLALASVVAALAAGALLHWSEWSTLARLAAGGTIMAVAYPVCLYAVGRFGELMAFIDALRGRSAGA
jgi:predicted acyltransferase